jgi:WD40 repeat protein
MLWGNRTPAADVWGEVTVSERMNGEIGLYPVGETKPTSVMTLPLGKLGVLRSFTASANLRFLAMSSRTRGGVWDLAKDEREILLRGFQRASYAPDSAFLVDFPEFEKADREIVDFSPTSKQVLEHRLTKDDDVTFFGDVFVRTKHNDKNRFADRNVELEALDTATEKPLWSRGFPKQGPWLDGSPGGGKIVLSWNAKADGVRDEVARNPKLQERWAKENPGDSDYLIEVLNARDGTTAGGIILRTGKFSYMAEHLDATGDWLAVADNRHRVLLYSIATGEQKAKLFGYRPQIAPNGERLGLANGRGYLAIYDLGSLKQISQLSFANPVSGEFFSADGRRLLVLTSDQTAFIIDVEEGSGGTSTTGH